MQEFIHNKVKVLDELFTEFNQVQRLYAEKSFEFESRFTVFLNKLSDYFKNRGDQAKESEVLRVTNMLHTVKRGFNPTNQEKVNTGRRELLWGFAYNGIENLNSLMQEIYGKETSKLEEGEELLSNLIKTALKLNLISNRELNAVMLRCEGYNYEEIAIEADTSEAAARKQYSRGIKGLKSTVEIMKSEGQIPIDIEI